MSHRMGWKRHSGVVLALAAGALLLTGCGTPNTRTVTLQIHSLPEGAAILQNGAVVGTTPTTVTYNAAAQFGAGQCITVQLLTAQWASGATSAVAPTLCPATGYSQQYTFLRPAGVAGAEVDARIAAGNQAASAARYAADAATADANARAIEDTINNAANNYIKPQPAYSYPQYTKPQITQPTRCKTTAGFGSLDTVCQK